MTLYKATVTVKVEKWVDAIEDFVEVDDGIEYIIKSEKEISMDNLIRIISGWER